MKLFKWLESKIFLGDVIKDYGNLQDDIIRFAHMRTSVLLCRRKGKLRFTFRIVGTAPYGMSAAYFSIDVTPQTIDRFAEIMADAKTELQTTGVD